MKSPCGWWEVAGSHCVLPCPRLASRVEGTRQPPREILGSFTPRRLALEDTARGEGHGVGGRRTLRWAPQAWLPKRSQHRWEQRKAG